MQTGLPNELRLNGEPIQKLNQQPRETVCEPCRVQPLCFHKALLNGQAEMLFDGSNTLLQPFYTFLNLAI